MNAIHLNILKQIITNNEYLCSESFYKKIKEDIHLFQCFSIQKVKAKYLFKPLELNIPYIKSYIEQYEKPNTNDRTIQAEYNNTHATNSKYSLLNILQGNHIYVKILEEDMFSHEEFKQGEIALIIENLENFILNEKIKKQLNGDADIIFGSGKSILNSKNYTFLSKYKKIYTFFDLDEAGFQMYISLKKNLKTSVENIYAENLPLYFQKIKQKKSFENLFSFNESNLEHLTKEDLSVLQLIKKYGTLEQEILIGEITQ